MRPSPAWRSGTGSCGRGGKDSMRRSSGSCGGTPARSGRRTSSSHRFLAAARTVLSAEARVFARMRAEGYDAADPARASARAIAGEWGAEGAASSGHFRPQGGYGALLAALAGGLRGSGVELRLQHVVRSVRWKHGRVEVEGKLLTDEGRKLARRSPPARGGVAHEVR